MGIKIMRRSLGEEKLNLKIEYDKFVESGHSCGKKDSSLLDREDR